MREPDLLHTALTERLDGIFILHYAFFILHSSKFPFILLIFSSNHMKNHFKFLRETALLACAERPSFSAKYATSSATAESASFVK